MRRQIGLCAAIVMLAAPAWGQGTEFQDALSGKSAPLTLTLKDLNTDWRRVSMGQAAGKGMDLGSMLGPLMSLGMMSEMGNKGNKNNDASSAALGMMMLSGMFGGGGGLGGSSEPVYYTKGQTLAVGGETFIVAYQVQKKQVDLMSMIADSQKNPGQEPDFSKMGPEKLTPDSTLTLSLLNLKTVGSLTNIRPFDMAKEIEESGKGSGLMDMLAQEAGKQGNQGGGAQAESVPAVNEDINASMAAIGIDSALHSDKTLSDKRNDINVDLQGKAIVITGHVATAAMKQRATNLAQKNIKAMGKSFTVKNQLTVRRKG